MQNLGARNWEVCVCVKHLELPENCACVLLFQEHSGLIDYTSIQGSPTACVMQDNRLDNKPVFWIYSCETAESFLQLTGQNV